MVRKAQELDPRSGIISCDIGKNLVFARRYKDAIEQLKNTLQLDPSLDQAHYWLSQAYMQDGNYAEAKAELDRARRFRGDQYFGDLAILEAKLGSKSKARGLLETAIKKLPADSPLSLSRDSCLSIHIPRRE
jgi:tetratricopeptide (TPR) repeat protein